ncbi:MAG: hypothetical protein IJV16_11540 [Lachnospiraceae bacterium]|nr:hypothetical protein [Lachnospiraceae bacterium]
MKERTRLSAGNMLLLELLFALIFFSLTLSVTLSVFGEAYALSRQAEGRNLAVAEANDVAEIIRSAAYASEMDGLLSLKGLRKEADGRYTAEYGDGKYRMIVSTGLQGRLYTADIECYDPSGSSPDEPIYGLQVDHAVKGGGADGR